MKTITIDFYSLWEDEKRDKIFSKINNRFKSDYPNCESSLVQDQDEEWIAQFKIEEDSIDEVDTFLCEEICHEHEVYCYIYSVDSRKEFYYDEGDDWVYKG